MLLRLCQCLYDAIRPLIIHINHIEILGEMCEILKYEFSQENIEDSREFIFIQYLVI